MKDGVLCTLDELTELVGTALAVDYPGPPTGRVRDVPDQRAIRWYVTRGIVDRPLATRGRVALYGRRHLLQLVAIKRRQADGRSLAEIQAELAGATDDTLAEVARLHPVSGKGRQDAPSRSRPAAHSRPAAAEPAAAEPAVDGHGDEPLPRRSRFWADRPQPSAATATGQRPVPGEGDTGPVPAGPPPDRRRVHAPAEAVALRGVRLAPGVTLLIEDAVAPGADVAAIRAAARPLLDLLAAGGHALHTSDEE